MQASYHRIPDRTPFLLAEGPLLILESGSFTTRHRDLTP